MKKPKTQKRSGAKSKVALAATMLTVPMAAVPPKAPAQEMKKTEGSAMHKRAEWAHIYMKFSEKMEKWHDKLSIIGVDDGHTIYKTDEDEYFWIDPATGDKKSLSSEYVIKLTNANVGGSSSARGKVFQKVEINRVTLLGVDAKGNVIQQNSKGEKFYLNPSTGDMVFVK